MMRTGSTVFLIAGLFMSVQIASPKTAQAQDKEAGDMIPNPSYTHWAAFKVGANVTRREKIKFPPDSEEGQRYPDHTLVKDISYKLLEVTPAKAVVEVIESEYGRGSIEEAAPFKISYLAKMKKGLETPKGSYAKHKQEEVEIMVHGKTYKATHVETVHKNGPLTRSHQVWLSDEVPGGILKDLRSQKEGDKTISESTLEIVSFKVP
jgi:hypothetical protein